MAVSGLRATRRPEAGAAAPPGGSAPHGPARPAAATNVISSPCWLEAVVRGEGLEVLLVGLLGFILRCCAGVSVAEARALASAGRSCLRVAPLLLVSRRRQLGFGHPAPGMGS